MYTKYKITVGLKKNKILCSITNDNVLFSILFVKDWSFNCGSLLIYAATSILYFDPNNKGINIVEPPKNKYNKYNDRFMYIFLLYLFIILIL
jgi:hypothetical protein